MKYPANLSHSGAKATLISVGAVVSVAAPAQATWYYSDSVTDQTVTLDNSGDKWYIDGGSENYCLQADSVSSGNIVFNLAPANIAGLTFTFAYVAGTGASTGRSFVTEYASGALIYDGSTLPTAFGVFDAAYYVYQGGSLSSFDLTNFSDTNSGYVAFSFLLLGTTYYGWAYLTFEAVGDPSVTITEWAYTSDESITVGQTAGFTIPEPAETAGGLGLLALGAAGMSRYLRNRKKTAA